MTPEEYCECLMDKLWDEGFFENVLTTRGLLAKSVLKLLKIIKRHTGKVFLSNGDFNDCLQEATEEYIDEALFKYSEMGLLTIKVAANGNMEYYKNVPCIKQLGHILNPNPNV